MDGDPDAETNRRHLPMSDADRAERHKPHSWTTVAQSGESARRPARNSIFAVFCLSQRSLQFRVGLDTSSLPPCVMCSRRLPGVTKNVLWSHKHRLAMMLRFVR